MARSSAWKNLRTRNRTSQPDSFHFAQCNLVLCPVIHYSGERTHYGANKRGKITCFSKVIVVELSYSRRVITQARPLNALTEPTVCRSWKNLYEIKLTCELAVLS